METIETKPGVTLGFYKPPVMPSKEEYTSDMRKCIYINNKILHVIFIDKLSEITEDQAWDLVGYTPLEMPHPHTGEPTKLRAFYNYIGGHSDGPAHSLQTAALSVGIEEKDFDQYLVIKL